MALGDGIRRNIATITEEERILFVDAILELNNRHYSGIKTEFPAGGVSWWFKQDEIHQATHVHGQNHFFPWHRELINRFELLLREVNPLLSLHYWDWNEDPTWMFTSNFMGSSNGFAGAPFEPDAALGRPGLYNSAPPGDAYRDDSIHGLTTAPGYALHANPADPPKNLKRSLQAGTPPVGVPGSPHWSTDSEIINATDFKDLNDWMQGAKGNAHGLAHSWIGATIQNAHTSFRDPFVFLLHSNLDRLWAMWQRKLPSVRLDPNHVYDPLGADPDINSPLQPWAGTGDWPTRPWAAPENEQNLPGNNKTSKDLSVVIPASYDTAVHSSYVVTDRDTFSSFELESSLSYPQAFYVIYDGFTPNELGGATPTISFHDGSISGAAIASITAIRTNTAFENAAALDTPQRISFTFEINFSNNSAFSFAVEMRNLVLKADLGSQTSTAAIHLINQPNPYMIDIQPGGSNPNWLSTDVRVFQLRPGMHLPGSSTSLADPADRPEAIQYIQNLVGELRGLGNGPSPFDFISQNEQASQLELSRSVGGVRVFNFAVAKVRYRANTTDATDVRVFFRGFNVMVSALDYNNPTAANGNYRRSAAGHIPLLGKVGSDIASIPYFANPRIDSAADDMNNQLDNTNKFTINHVANQEAIGYFGCWLDFNQTEPQFPLNPSGDGNFTTGRQSILQLARGVHQCLVAEVRFQPGVTDPIQLGATPGSSNRLAQRNLAVVESDNPGVADAHVVQHTVTVKPSNVPQGRILAAANIQRFAYDELVIKWNKLPRDTKATLFFPEWNVDEVLQLASTLRQRPSLLKKVDKNTLECIVTDISYIPVPSATKPYAGLITLELPQTVRDGQVFPIDVQQHSGIIVEIQQQNKEGKQPKETQHYFASTRKVLGAFRMTVAVKLGDGLLHTAVRNLAVLRYIDDTIPVTDRWHPIFSRYIKQVAAKVDALGYDSNLVKASPDDPGLVGRKEPVKEQYYIGKIQQITYDCFGEFTGFTLETCSETHFFESCERGIEEVVLKACRHRLTIKVFVGGKHIQKLIIKCC